MTLFAWFWLTLCCKFSPGLFVCLHSQHKMVFRYSIVNGSLVDYHLKYFAVKHQRCGSSKTKIYNTASLLISSWTRSHNQSRWGRGRAMHLSSFKEFSVQHKRSRNTQIWQGQEGEEKTLNKTSNIDSSRPLLIIKIMQSIRNQLFNFPGLSLNKDI